jgi:amidase
LRGFASQGVAIEALTPDFDPERIWQSWLTLRSFGNAGGKRIFYDDPEKHALLKPELIFEIERGLALTAMQVHDASVARTDWFAYTARLFDRYDVLALPSAQVFPFDAEWRWPQSVAGRQMTTYHQWMEIVLPASLIGLPALNVPVGFSPEGLPMGMQLIGRRGSDRRVLQIGEAYHRATDWPNRRPPVL